MTGKDLNRVITDLRLFKTGLIGKILTTEDRLRNPEKLLREIDKRRAKVSAPAEVILREIIKNGKKSGLIGHIGKTFFIRDSKTLTLTEKQLFRKLIKEVRSLPKIIEV